MIIGIDARLYGPEHTGLGRYVTNLVDNLLVLDKVNKYVLFVNQSHVKDFKPSPRLKIVSLNIPIYGFLEQIVLPFIYSQHKLDLLHVPHFNAPIFYLGKMVLTIHDLIKHASTGPSTTTHSSWLYGLKRLGYHIATNIVSRRAIAILVPSEYVKRDVAKRLKVPLEKIFVTYESTSSAIKRIKLNQKETQSVLNQYDLTQPFLIYTGNIYPHKNVETLIEAVIKHNSLKEVDLSLAIVCGRSIFWDRLREKIEKAGAQDKVKMFGSVNDLELSKLYSLALALVHPSKMEGFGLTGLEAMGVGLPVISSDQTSLPEVYGNACEYFSPDSVDSLVAALAKVIKDPDLRRQLSEKGLKQVKKYSWLKMSKETLAIYQKVDTK